MAQLKKKRKLSARTVISRVLLSAGAACILFVIVSEAIDYPWQVLFSDEQALNEQTLPEPKPPEIEFIDARLSAEQSKPTAPPVTEAPEEPKAEAPAPLPEGGDGYLNFNTVKSLPTANYPTLVLLGTIKIPKLKISVNIVEDTNARSLLAGVGHIPYTPAIGEKGNTCLAGHRLARAMHPFRHLDKVAAGDTVILSNGAHTYIYTVKSSFIVDKSENWVLGKVDDIEYCATLITCTPVGSEAQRIIVRCELTDIDGMPPADFFAAQKPETMPGDAEDQDPSTEPPEGEATLPTEETSSTEGETPEIPETLPADSDEAVADG